MVNYPKAVVQIYDRFGKLLIQLDQTKLNWDGTLNNKVLPADDYWYVLKMNDNGEEFKGHFSLKR